MSARRRLGRSTSAAALVALVALASGGAYAALGRPTGSNPPRPKITAGPPKVTSQTQATFGFSSKSPVDFLCSLDAAGFTACGSGTTGSVAYSGPLADGEHTFRVETQFGARIGKPIRRSWTVDTHAPPPPYFKHTPPASTSKKKVTFRYSDVEQHRTFECRLDGAPYLLCGSKKQYRNLTTGAHAFCVRAVDKARNTSGPTCTSWLATSASAAFSISGGPSAAALLYPGAAAVPIDLVFTNSNAMPITVQSVTVSVTGTSAGACGAANFSVSQQLQATPMVPAGATVSLQALGVGQSDWPQLRMLDVGNQDACRNASVTLAYTGTATG